MDGLGRRTAPSLIYQYAGACLVPLATLEPAAERKCKVREMAWSAQQHPENAATVLDPGVSIADWHEHHLTLSAVKGL
jgi:hypothetical protein